MASCIDDGWGNDDDLDVSATSLGNCGWGDDDDLFGDDSDNSEGDGDLDFSSATPARIDSSATTYPVPKIHQSWSDDEKLENESDLQSEAGVNTMCRHHVTTIKTAESHIIASAEAQNIPMQNEANLNGQSMVAELSNYIQSLGRMLSSINALLISEYNTCQKAEELVDYYERRPQLADYTRTKELQRMDYEVVLPDGYVEKKKERIISENLLPDNAIVSRAANQSLLADLIMVITGHDLIVRPQYFTICIATWCKFIVHHGDNGSDLIDCRARLSILLPTTEGDRLSIAEASVSVIFSPNQPMVEFNVLNIEVLLKDFSKLTGVAEFLSAMECNNEDPELNASPDIYRDAFLEKSQRFFALSSEGMMSAFKQMDSVINLKGKIKTISKFIPDTDQMLAAEQEAEAVAEARKKESQHQQGRQHLSTFPRPARTTAHNSSHDESQNALNSNQTIRPKSILGGLVRSGWKTLANSVAIPDDDPAIYGELVQSQPPQRPPNQPLQLYRKEEKPAPVVPTLYERVSTQTESIPNQVQRTQTHDQESGYPNRQLGGSDISNKVNFFENSADHLTGSAVMSQNLSAKKTFSESRTTPCDQTDPYSRLKTEFATDDSCTEKQIEKCTRPESSTGLIRQTEKEENHGNHFEDGWDDDFDDFDDLDDMSENFDEPFIESKSSLEGGNEGEKQLLSSSDVAVEGTSMSQEKMDLNCDPKYDPETDICETRKRWVNPRPNRPYLKY